MAAPLTPTPIGSLHYPIPVSYQQWAQDLIDTLNAKGASVPSTQANIDFISAWEQSEAPVSQLPGNKNPLNNEQPYGNQTGGLEPGSNQVPTFTSYAGGLDASASEIMSPAISSAGVLADLESGNPTNGPADVTKSGWGSSGSLISQILGQGGASTATASGSGSGNVTGTSASGGAGSGSSNAIKLSGVAGVLQQINDLMNPPSLGVWASISSVGAANILQIIELTVSRIVFTVGFLGVAYIGVKQITGGSGSSNVVQIVEKQQSLANSRESTASKERNANTLSSSRERVAATPSVKYNVKLSKSESDVYHHSSSGSRAKSGAAAKGVTSEAGALTEGALLI